VVNKVSGTGSAEPVDVMKKGDDKGEETGWTFFRDQVAGLQGDRKS
jgi:hypothetical protein